MTSPETGVSDDADLYASVDVLASDFIARYRSGDRPTVDEYANRHPELSETIRSIFPLALSVEKVKVDGQAEPDGSATLAGRLIERLGDFRLVREIGRGGMGIVYEAMQESLGRTVAIKLLPKQSLLDDESLWRFQHEAKTAAAMHHSNIVPIFGTGETDGTHYLVMQLVAGQSLDKRIADRETNAFHYREIAEIGRQVADALAYSHASGILHRDIKPANILIDENGTAQVTDFGLARNTRDDPTMTQALSGSPRYMAPERFRGQSDARSDIYALGLTLYEMVAGAAAFTDSDPHQLMESVRQHRIQPLSNIRPDVPIDLKTIINKAISPEPGHRYQSSAELRDDLGRYLSDQPIQARRISNTARLIRWCRRNPRIATTSAIAVASLLLATLASTGGWMMTSAANERANAALRQSEQTVDLALQSLDGIVDMVSVPVNGLGDVSPNQSIGPDESAATTLTLNPSPHTAQVLASIQPIYERLSRQSPTRPDIVEQMIGATIRHAMIQRQLGQADVAIQTLQTGIETLTGRAETAGLSTEQSRLLFARLHNELGEAYENELRFNESDIAFGSAIKAANDLPRTNRDGMLQLARAHTSLGDPSPQRRRMEPAGSKESQPRREHLNVADGLLQTLHENSSSVSQVESLRARVKLAQSHLERRPIAKRAKFNDAIEILRQQLAVTPNDTAARFTLVEALAAVNLRRQAQNTSQKSEATDRLEQSLAELETLQQQVPETPVFRVSEIHIRHKLANLAKTNRDYDAAHRQLQKAITIQSTLIDTTPNSLSHRCWRALLYRSLAEVADLSGDQDAKTDAITKAVEDMDAITTDDLGHPFVVQTQQIIRSLQTDSTDSE